MAKLRITDACTGCSACVDACPYDGIEVADALARFNEKCSWCGTCKDACPFEAIVEEEEPARAPAADLGEYSDVWIFGEQRDGFAE